MRLHYLAIAMSLAILVACAAREELVAKGAEVPAGISLSGRWQLREDSKDTVRRISEAEREAAGGSEAIGIASQRKARRNANRSSAGATVHVFLETGRLLKITQTDYGLFISFDRSVVEEYRFGEVRQVNVGPIAADRVSGWSGSHYVIETLDEDGARLTETYRLGADSDSLIRRIVIVADDDSLLDIEQVFDRT